MKSSEELRAALRAIDRKSYPAYKSLAGVWRFPGFILGIDHVQGDPFAAPSRLHVWIGHEQSGFPSAYRETRRQKIALSDYLIRRFAAQAGRYSFRAKGSGKSGVMAISRCGQEVLERTACEIAGSGITVRFAVGFPAFGRTIDAEGLEKILFTFLPACVEESLLYARTPIEEVRQTIHLAEDQGYIRAELEKRGLAAFVADGAVLPRESGVSDRPLRDAVAFRSPETLAVTLELPHKGPLRGMGIPKGVTVIAGGGFHGKSTLLRALERGVYDHIAGDGREYVITDGAAVKIRAEDGRKITNTDISLFIRDLPSGQDTTHFCTLNASGSTSQAANILEGIEAGSRLLLIDEDTSATNLMIRDSLMERVVAKDKEPITPFLERARDLYQKAGVSSILVVGSSGAYFHIADTILQMDAYRAVDITAATKKLLEGTSAPAAPVRAFQMPVDGRTVDFSGAAQTRKTYRGDGYIKERLKIKTLGKTAFTLGGEDLDLRYLEQLVDEEQTRALAYMLRWVKEHWHGEPLVGITGQLLKLLSQKSFSALCGDDIPPDLAMPRQQEIFACLSRC